MALQTLTYESRDSSRLSRLFLFPLSRISPSVLFLLQAIKSPSITNIGFFHPHLHQSLLHISCDVLSSAWCINCGAGDRGLCRKCMWVYASEDGWVQTSFNIKPKTLPLGCLSTALLRLILYPSSVDLFFLFLPLLLIQNPFDLNCPSCSPCHSRFVHCMPWRATILL